MFKVLGNSIARRFFLPAVVVICLANFTNASNEQNSQTNGSLATNPFVGKISSPALMTKRNNRAVSNLRFSSGMISSVGTDGVAHGYIYDDYFNIWGNNYGPGVTIILTMDGPLGTGDLFYSSDCFDQQCNWDAPIPAQYLDGNQHSITPYGYSWYDSSYSQIALSPTNFTLGP